MPSNDSRGTVGSLYMKWQRNITMPKQLIQHNHCSRSLSLVLTPFRTGSLETRLYTSFFSWHKNHFLTRLYSHSLTTPLIFHWSHCTAPPHMYVTFIIMSQKSLNVLRKSRCIRTTSWHRGWLHNVLYMWTGRVESVESAGVSLPHCSLSPSTRHTCTHHTHTHTHTRTHVTHCTTHSWHHITLHTLTTTSSQCHTNTHTHTHTMCLLDTVLFTCTTQKWSTHSHSQKHRVEAK